MTNQDPASSLRGPRRRDVLRGTALAGGAVVLGAGLAGCGGGGGAPGEDGSGVGGDGANSDQLARASDVPVGGGVINQDAKVVVTQPVEGEFKAFDATCTHTQCPVTNVESGTINCQCHGSRFSIEDGSVKQPPATEPLAEVKVKVEGGSVLRA